MPLGTARVNAAQHHKPTQERALGLQVCRTNRPPANRARIPQTIHRDIRYGRARRRGNLATSCMTWYAMNKHSEEV